MAQLGGDRLALRRLRFGDLEGERAREVQSFLKGAFPECFAERDDYYAQEAPALILLLRDGASLIGHLAIYERAVEIAGETLTIGMIGGVAVARRHRRRGHARSLIEAAHEHLRSRRIPFAILMAFLPRIYQTCGYRLMNNETHFLDDDDVWKTFIYRGSMYAELLDRRWPDQTLDLRGRVV